MEILFIVLANLLHSGEGVFIKKYNQKYSEGGFIFISVLSLCSMLFFLITDLISDKNGLEFTTPVLILGVFAGIAYATASLATFVAMGEGSYVLSRLVLSYGILVTVGHGLVIGEKLSVFGVIGLILILFSLYFFKGEKEGESVKITKKWVVYISLSVLLAGVFGIIQRQQQIEYQSRYNNEFMIISLAVSATVLFILGMVLSGKRAKYVLKTGVPYAASAGVCNGATNLVNLYVYTIAPLSIIGPTGAGVAIIISFLISKLLFKERFTRGQLLGVVLGTVAIILFKI